MKKKEFLKGIVFLPALLPILFLFAGCGAVLHSVEKDKEIGRQTAEMVKTEIGVYDDAPTTTYLNQIGHRLVRVNPDQNFDYTFSVVDQYEPNAFALPGGYIYVSRGLLALANDEDELANVIGHEIIHVSRRHSARQMAKARVPVLLTLPGLIIGSVISQDIGNLINAPINAIGGAYIAKHSRQDEFEADQLGQQLAAQAGYNPQALAPMLDRLEDTVELIRGEKHRPGFFDTHPSTPDRVGRVIRDAQKIEWSPQTGIAPNSDTYLGKLDGLLLGVNPACGVFHGQKFLHPDLDLSIEFPADWTAVNNRQAVIAVAPKEDAMLTLGIGGEGIEPWEAAGVFERRLYDAYGAKPTRSESVKIGKLPAYLLTYTDAKGKEPMHLAFLWIAYRGVVYRFIGLAPERYRETLRATALSFRPMTALERSSIKERRLRVVAARANERLAQLCQRTGNVWDPKVTAIVNGIDEAQPLKNGQLIKIAVLNPYKALNH